MIILHVIIASLSIGSATYTFISPSKHKLWASYILVGLTLISGTYLVFSKPTQMLQVCVEGLVYIGAVSIALLLARRKLINSASVKI